AAATAWIFSVTVREADAAESDSDIVASDVLVMVVADVSSSADGAASDPTSSPIMASKSPVAALMRWARDALIADSALAASSDALLAISASLKIWSARGIWPIS